MRAIKLLLFAIVIAAAGAVRSQPPADKAAPAKPAPAGDKAAPAKDSLEQLLTDALRNSPEIQLADAKVREAEAELRRTRMQIMQRVVEQHAAADAHRQKVANAESAVQRMNAIVARGGAAQSELANAKAELETAKAAAKQIELSLNGLTGRFPAGIGGGALGVMGGMGAGGPGMMGGTIGFLGGAGALGGGGGALGIAGGGMAIGEVPEAPVRSPRGPVAAKVRAALNKTMKINKIEGVPLKEVVEFFRDAVGDVPILPQIQSKRDEQVALALNGEISVGSAFQALQDVVPGLQCFVREYGILITVDGSGPDDAMPLLDFWREEKPRPRVPGM